MMESGKRSTSKRSGNSKHHRREHRLKKSNIGQPMKIKTKDKSSDITDSKDVTSGSNMVMKCVIVQRDEKGYGLTVSGVDPVSVESVNEGGAAARAGVLEGDLLIEVNGRKSTHLNHAQVLDLINAESYATLLLHGLSSSLAPSSGNKTISDSTKSTAINTTSSITKNYAFQDQKLEMIEKMLMQEGAEVERIKEEYARNPEEKILHKLRMTQKVKQDLEKQLWKAKVESMNENDQELPQTVAHSAFSSADAVQEVCVATTEVSLIDMEDTDNTIKVRSSTNVLSQKPNKDSIRTRRNRALTDFNLPEEEEHSNMELLNEFQPNNLFTNYKIYGDGDRPSTPRQNKEIMNFEDDDIADACNPFQDHGPFNDLDKLRQRPAYLAVFLNYLISSHEPANFLLSFALDNYRQLSSSKEMSKQAESIFKTYLASNALFKVDINEGITRSIQLVISAKNMPEETLRGVFDPAVQVSNKEIRNQLSKYREKRELGLGNLIGDDKLPPVDQLMDPQLEPRIVDEVIGPTLNELLQSSCDEAEQARHNVITDALQVFLTQYGTKRKSKIASKMYSMLRSKQPQNNLIKGKMTGSMDSILDDARDKRSSGFMTFLGGTKKKNSTSVMSRGHHDRKESKREKLRAEVLWGNSSTLMKPTIVSSSLSVGDVIDRSSVCNDCDVVVTSHTRIDDQFNTPAARPNSLPPIETSNAEWEAGPPPPMINEPTSRESDELTSYPAKHVSDDVNDAILDNHSLTMEGTKIRSRSGSFRRHTDDVSQCSGHIKSHSDPDSDDVAEAISQHNSSHDPPMQQPVSSSSDSSNSAFAGEGSPIDLTVLSGDPEINVDSSEQQWSETVPRDTIRLIDRKEIKRQEVINELIYTEQHHVRDLRILEKVFYEPIQSENLLSKEELVQAFPNLAEILKLHRDLNKDLQEAKERDGHVVKNIGDILLERFTSEAGNNFKNECAIYCGNQSTVLSLIKEKSKKDHKFNQYIEEAQKSQICRKLHLKDFIPMEFQRLTKYPLLLENLIQNTNKKKQEKECEKLRKVCEKCREILSFVNQTVKEAEDKQKIKEIQQNLDKTPLLKSSIQIVKSYKSIDLTEHPIVHHGLLAWRIGQMDKRKELALHCILYDEVMVLLHKQDDKYVLKCHGQSASSSGGTHAPFIAMAKVIIVRNVATDKRAFFVMSSSDVGPQMYEFVTSSTNDRKQWMQLISETSKKDTSRMTSFHRREAFLVPGSSHDESNTGSIDESNLVDTQLLVGRDHGCDESLLSIIPNNLSAEDRAHLIWSKLQTKEQEIKQALSDKYRLLTQMSNIDVEDSEAILGSSSADDDTEPKTIVMHSLLCVDKLTGLLNDCATPESTFVKSRSDSDMVPTPSNRLSVEILEAGYHSDNGAASPPERWAEPVSHPDQSENDERSSLQHELSSSATLNSMSDIPFSEAPSDGESSPTQQHHQVVIDAEQSYETRDQVMSDVAKIEDGDMKVRMRNKDDFFFDSSKMLSVPDDNVSSSSKSRPLSGVELLTRVDVVPIKKLMEIAINLQTQLTKLMQLSNENDSERRRIAEENRQLREEIKKITNEEATKLPCAEAIEDR